jgi:hypothetical protein
MEFLNTFGVARRFKHRGTLEPERAQISHQSKRPPEQGLATIGKPVSRRARNSGIMRVAGAQAPRLPSSFLHLCYVPLAPMEVFR